MRDRLLAMSVVAVGLAAGGCQDPEVAIELRFPAETVGSMETALADAVTRLEVSVFQFTNADCDALTYGEVSGDVQDESRRSRVVLSRSANGFHGRVSGIPRLADSVIAVRGFDASGQQLAGGCVDVTEDIEADVAIPIELARSLIVRVLPSELTSPSLRLPTDDGDTVSLFVRYRDLDAVVPLSALRIRLRSRPTDEEDEVAGWTIDSPSTPATEASGIFTISGLSSPIVAVGPLEVVVRGAWADQVTRISAGVPPSAASRVRLGSVDDPNQGPARWAVMELDLDDDPDRVDTRVVAVARYLGTSGVQQLVVVKENDDDQMEAKPGFAAQGVEALTVFTGGGGRQYIVGRNATGWAVVDWQSDPPALATLPPDTSTQTAPEQLLGVPPCQSQARSMTSGVLGVVDGTVLGWERLDGSPPATTGPIANLATGLRELLASGASIELIDAECATVRVVPAEPSDLEVIVPIVLARVWTTEGPVIYAVSSELVTIRTPFVGGVAIARVNGRSAILGVTLGAAGPRVGTYRLRYDDPAQQPTAPPALVPDLVVDHPVPSLASAVTALAGVEGAVDTLSLHDLPTGLGLSMTRGAVIHGQELSAMTVLPGAGDGQLLRRIAFNEQPNGQAGRDEILIAGDQGLAIYDVSPGGMQ